MLNVKYIKLDDNMKETLAQFIRRVREKKGLSLRDVERNSRQAISSGYVSQLENGHVNNPTGKKRSALAKGLEIDIELLNELDSEKVTETTEFKDSIFGRAFDLYSDVDEEWKDYMRRSIESLISYVENRPQKEKGNNKQSKKVG